MNSSQLIDNFIALFVFFLLLMGQSFGESADSRLYCGTFGIVIGL